VSHARTRRSRRDLYAEPLEARDVPTVLAHPLALHPAAAVLTPHQGVTNVSQGITGSPTAPPASDAGGLPTSHEVSRQRFIGKFKGDYIIGPGRYTDQAAALSSLGYGGSNRTLHLLSNMRLVLPTDANQPSTGQIYMAGRDVATTGSALVLDLTGVAGSDFRGFPTRYTWTVDPASGGVYTSASGEGTFDLTYFRSSPGPQPGMVHGQLQFTINGFVNVAGIFHNTGLLGNLPNGER
jgi:hypothetical protein